MFYYLKGMAVQKKESFLVLDIGGAGFKVFSSQASLASVALNQEVTMYTYTYVREDALDIFGFTTVDELSFFEKLIGISGVGPRLALGILSTFSPQEILVALLSGDAKKLSKAPGVGPKLAQRMILELRDKIQTDEVKKTMKMPPIPMQTTESKEAIDALVALGYGEAEARSAVASFEEGTSLEEIIKKALLVLAR